MEEGRRQTADRGVRSDRQGRIFALCLRMSHTAATGRRRCLLLYAVETRRRGVRHHEEGPEGLLIRTRVRRATRMRACGHTLVHRLSKEDQRDFVALVAIR